MGVMTSCGEQLVILDLDNEEHAKLVKMTRRSDVSPKVLSKAAVLPKDKHGMPTYSSGKHDKRLVRMTAYSHYEADHITYGKKSAAGSKLKFGENERSAAADWSVYPLGTRFQIKGSPYVYIVDDYGSALVGTNTIDIYKPSMGRMNQWGTKHEEIKILEWGSFEESERILRGRRGYKHCRKMHDGILHHLAQNEPTNKALNGRSL